MNPIRRDLSDFIRFLVVYCSRKTHQVATQIERAKNILVKISMYGRGRFQKQIFHSSMIGLAVVGILTSGVIGGGSSMVAPTFPGVGGPDPRLIETFDPFASGVSLESLVDYHTLVSEKPRSEIIEHTVRSGETLSQIAKEYNISPETIKWANNLSDVHSLKPGQTLKILPVSGVAHTVKSGDTLESVAKKYSAEPQGIVDFPFNDLPDDFKLAVGQMLIIPDGSPPQVKVPPRRLQPQYIAQGPSSLSFAAPGGGSFIWPTSGGISQYFAWYHPGIDIPNKAAPGIAASDGGTVVVAGWPDNYGYGNRVVIDHGNGYRTLYAHLSNVYVSNGQTVSRGQVIGKMGSTGRSTGVHLHFEIHFKGIAVNPLAILK